MIAVLGIPRSGTSAVAGVLHHLGFNLGEELWPADSEWNAKGFFTDARLAGLHDKLVPKPFKLTLLDSIALENYQAFFMSKKEPWAVNEYRLPFLWSIFAEIVANIQIIHTQRPFHECSMSWSARNKIHPFEAAADLSSHLFAVDLALTSRLPILNVEFSNLLRKPERTVREIADFACIPYRQEAADFIDPKLRRFGNDL